MTDVLPEAAAARLTARLRGAGVLEWGEVADLAVETSRDTLVSRITWLRLTYDVAVVTPGPSHVFVKSQRDGIDSSCRGPAAASWPFAVSSVTAAALLRGRRRARWALASDARGSHRHARADRRVTTAADRLLARRRGRPRAIHAAWWDHERLGVSVGAFGDESGVFDRHLAAAPEELAVASAPEGSWGAVSESGRSCRGNGHQAQGSRRWRVQMLAILRPRPRRAAEGRPCPRVAAPSRRRAARFSASRSRLGANDRAGP